jgi:hypothetical protein
MLLPFTIIFLGLSPSVSKIIAKFDNLNPFIVASLISFFGFLGIYIFHANEIQVGVNLGVISVGLTLINTVAMNIILLLTQQFGGVVIGVVQVFTFTGMALGSVISGLYMQSFQTTIPAKQEELPFPSGQAYDFIFLTAAVASFIFIILALVLKTSIHQDLVKPSSVKSTSL